MKTLSVLLTVALLVAGNYLAAHIKAAHFQSSETAQIVKNNRVSRLVNIEDSHTSQD